MPTFAPVYREPVHSRSHLRKEALRGRKRKREYEEPDASEESSSGSDASGRASYPVNSRDPYYVAGHARERPVPGGNFPHAAAVSPSRAAKTSLQSELAHLNPPLFVSSKASDGVDGSSKRRHLDNLIAILHQCMMRGDWERADRAWAILIRSEIDGRGIDIRSHGRWLLGAELLMRRGRDPRNRDSQDYSEGRQEHNLDGNVQSGSDITDDGLRAARSYYERLILQYPHNQHARDNYIHASVIYPALFNIWIYECQRRSRRARESIRASSDSSSASPEQWPNGGGTAEKQDLTSITETELTDVLEIVQRLDALLESPPYDTQRTLLELRGMLALWLVDINKELARVDDSFSDAYNSDQDELVTGPVDGTHAKRDYFDDARRELDKAKQIFENLVKAGAEIPEQYTSLI